MKKSTILFLLLFLGLLGYTQNFEIGAEMGYGKTGIEDPIRIGEIFYFPEDLSFKSGINIAYNPKKTFLFITSGLFYQLRETSGTFLHFMRLPLGVIVEPGNKVKFLIGAGVYLNYFFNASGKENFDISGSKRDFQVGVYIAPGIKYRIVPKWWLFIKIQLDIDLTTLYIDVSSHKGNKSYSYERAKDLTFNLGFTYIIPHKNNEQ